MNATRFTSGTYHFEIPLNNGGKCVSNEFYNVEDCVRECRRMCEACGVDYDIREVRLFLTDADGTEECTEEGELAG